MIKKTLLIAEKDCTLKKGCRYVTSVWLKEGESEDDWEEIAAVEHIRDLDKQESSNNE